MSHDAQLPDSVEAARVAVAARGRASIALLLGMGGFLLLAAVGNLLGAPNLVVFACIIGTMVWALGVAGFMSSQESRWQRAEDVLKAWDQRLLADQLAPEPPAGSREPDDPRWPSLRTLLDRIRALAAHDAHLLAVIDDVAVRLRGLLDDRATLIAAVDADRALGATSEAAQARTARLVQALEACSQTADRLIEAVRDLHAELAVRDASTDPLVDRLASLLAQVEAEAEVVSVTAEAPGARARQASARARSEGDPGARG